MSLFTNVALNKLNQLIERKGFRKIIDIDEDYITVQFGDKQHARISRMGKVIWYSTWMPVRSE